MLELTLGRPLRVVLALAKPIERHGLHQALDETDDIEVVAEVGDAQVVDVIVAACQPHVVVWDCQLGVSLDDSLTVIERLRRWVAVLAFGPLDEVCVVPLVAAGARGYLYHGDDLERVAEAVRACGEGEAWYSPAVVPFLVAGRPGWPRHHWPQRGGLTRDDPRLTERQWDALRLAAKGQSNKEIAQALGIQRSTVEEHLTQVYAKLGVSGRPGAVRWYVEREMRGGRNE